MNINEMPLNDGAIFERAYDVLLTQMNDGVIRAYNGDKTGIIDASLFVAVVVNGAFACELYLKSMLPNNIHKHRLDELYAELSVNIQNEIRNMTVKNMKKILPDKEYSSKEFDNDITNMGNSFVEWRYFYEMKSKNTSPQFLKAFMQAITSVAVNHTT